MLPLKIKLLVIGKIKHSYLQEGIQDYLKRLKHYSKTEIVELPQKRLSSNLSQNEILRHEYELFHRQIDSAEYLISLNKEGKVFDSLGFANALQAFMNQNRNRVSFLIGGELGLSKELLTKSDEIWSFSKLTFTHDMMRLIFLEQLYRSFTILAGQKYHK